MKLRRAHIILVDISGYTQFIRLHRTSLIHTERIVTHLLDSVIDAAQPPLTLNKLEGDAALFYATMEETADAASQQQEATALLRQLERFFSVFRLRERELVSECSLCACEACARSGDLRLKIIAHTGTILVKQVRQFEEIAGEDVIVAHRLLKNSVPGDEYLLLTEPFHALSGPAQEGRSVSLMEKWDGHGSLKIHVHYPPDAVRPSTAPVSVWRKIRTHLWLDRHMVKRLFSKSERTFHHLPARTREEPRP